MSVEVYIWSHNRHDSWGHSALQVRPGPYISWWPTHDDEERHYTIDRRKHPGLAKIMGKLIGTTNVYKVKHRCAMSLLEDINMEERNPQIKVEIADGVLDEEPIERWWQRYNYEAASFHTIKKNCSTTV